MNDNLHVDHLVNSVSGAEALAMTGLDTNDRKFLVTGTLSDKYNDPSLLDNSIADDIKYDKLWRTATTYAKELRRSNELPEWCSDYIVARKALDSPRAIRTLKEAGFRGEKIPDEIIFEMLERRADESYFNESRGHSFRDYVSSGIARIGNYFRKIGKNKNDL